MFSRYLVIVMATGLAVYQVGNQAWVEAMGLSTLSIGLICLRLADTQQLPALKRVARLCFVVTAVAMVVVFQRDYLR